MTSKKRRQRGSRTHGGGSHKNRRGAGNRGGRGNAGRDKHEFHNHPPLGKDGFDRPESVRTESSIIKVQKIDEDIAIFSADGLAEKVNGAYRVDVRDVVEDGYEEHVKVLGSGKVYNSLEVVADSFSGSAIQLIESAGGEAILTEDLGSDSEIEEDHEVEGEVVSGPVIDDAVAGCAGCATPVRSPNGSGGSDDLNDEDGLDDMSSDDDLVGRYRRTVEDGEELSGEEVEEILDIAEDNIEEAYELIVENYRDVELSADDVLNLYEVKSAADRQGLGTGEVSELLDGYFEDIYSESRVERLQYGMDEPGTVEDVREEMEGIEEAWENLVEVSDNEPNPEGLETEKKRYLMAVRSKVA